MGGSCGKILEIMSWSVEVPRGIFGIESRQSANAASQCARTGTRPVMPDWLSITILYCRAFS